MKTQIENVMVFRSNIGTENDVDQVSNAFDAHPDIEEWSVDLNDSDNVLRIVSCKLKEHDVIKLVKGCGYNCEELID